ncbi:MAG: hypothetical protein QOF51_3419 [Chloroflexota bacterium]|nr:hypothetical protein [Chloroflexota bacterium]
MSERDGRRWGLVTFDCDGVLVDSEEIACRVIEQALAEIGLPVCPFLGMPR